jgi:putative adhesin
MKTIERMAWCALGLALVGAGPAAAEDFAWRGRMGAGQTLEIYGVNGGITAESAGGGEVEVTAVKRGRNSDPSTVEIKVVEHGDGVTVCAVYPSRGGRRNTCEQGGGHQSTNNNDVQVEFRVKVPAGVKLGAHTVNGAVTVTDVEGDVAAETVNGNVAVSSGGLVKAETVNGSIDAKFGRADWTGTLEFETVNGSITLALPADLATDVDAEVLNGRISSDFGLAGDVRQTKRTLKGTIGGGGRGLHLESVNGSITLRRN